MEKLIEKTYLVKYEFTFIHITVGLTLTGPHGFHVVIDCVSLGVKHLLTYFKCANLTFHPVNLSHDL